MVKKRPKNYVYLVLLLVLWAGAAITGSSSADAESAGNSYYIDPVNGSDKNDGSSSAPWRSFKHINSYYQTSYTPKGWVDLKPGDCIMLKGGVYDETFTPGAWQKGPTGGGSFIAYFRGKKGTPDKPFRIKGYDGVPILDPKGKGIGLSIFQSSRGHRDSKCLRSRDEHK